MKLNLKLTFNCCFILIAALLWSGVVFAGPVAGAGEGAQLTTPFGCEVVGQRYVPGNKCNGGGCYVPIVDCCGNNRVDGTLYDSVSGEVIYSGESCDGTPGCRANCTLCGDGIVQAADGEQCDLGSANGAPGSNCNAQCKTPVCGNGILETGNGEQCDDGNTVNGDGCDNSCRTEVCGNGRVDAGEQCDDGNTVNNDACTNDCKTKRCGDGIVQTPEQCDDGNTNNYDACKNDCSLHVCGDHILGPGEQCDGSLYDPAFQNKPGKSCDASCQVHYCGDGVVNSGEQCDDGNTVNNDACSNLCVAARCGDGVVQHPEQCDDGNTVNTDACSNSCQNGRCGDGILQAGEQCDDGNTVNNDTCPNSCQNPRCGDGILQSPEQCDDGNNIDNDGCSNMCWFPYCGDGIVQSGEQCDDGNRVDNDQCPNSCQLPRCGDGIIQTGEQCDDGNTVNNDGCSNTCGSARCGDGIIQSGEQCDDGNTVNNDACSNSCQTPRCGDGVLQSGEQCDDGNTVNNDYCTNQCTTPRCGDGVVQHPEQCDDGNTVNNDACSNSCLTPRCGDGVLQSGEQCDDGNTINNDYCTNQCTTPRCGDGVVQHPEQCDDGNTVNNDGCNNSCQGVCTLYKADFYVELNYTDWQNGVGASNRNVIGGNYQPIQGCLASIFNITNFNAKQSYDNTYYDDYLWYDMIEYLTGVNQGYSLAYNNTVGTGNSTYHKINGMDNYFFDANCNPVHMTNYDPNMVCGVVTVGHRVSPISLDFGGVDSWTVVQFKLHANQEDQWVVWKASANKPLLVLDTYGNGEILDGRQLFGNWTFGGKDGIKPVAMNSKSSVNYWSNGYEALAQFDADGNGYVEGQELAKISLWFDRDQDAVSDRGEVVPVTAAGIERLNVNYDIEDQISGNLVSLNGFERKVAGKTQKGASVDWYTGVYSSKVAAVAELDKVSKVQPSLLTEMADLAEPEAPKARQETANLSGVWLWRAEGDSKSYGIFGLQDEDGKIKGNSVVEEPLLDNAQGLKSHLVRVPLAGERHDVNGTTHLTFKVEVDGVLTKSEAVFDPATDTLKGISSATGNGQSITYSWVAQRKPVPARP